MPTYEYHCENCGENTNVFQSMSSPALEICPKCGARGLHRLISGGSGIIFKGSGFYCTDYKGHNASTPATEESHESAHSHHADKSDAKSKTPSSDGASARSSDEKPKI